MIPSKKSGTKILEKENKTAAPPSFKLLMSVPLTTAAIDKILDNLYLGNCQGSREKDLLKKKGITHILVAGRYLPKWFAGEFEYHSLPLMDFMSENLFPYIEQAIEFIRTGSVVFVHCAAGVSRSSSIVIAYLMIDKKMKFQEAYEFVKKRRPVICPNPGFQAQLKKIEELLAKKTFDIKKLATMPPPRPTLLYY